MAFREEYELIERRIEALRQKQPIRVSRIAFINAILTAACDACERTGDPAAWRWVGRDQSANAA